MRKRRALALFLCLWMACMTGAFAQAQAPLAADELLSWRDGLWSQLRTMQVVNNPEETMDEEGSGTWLFEYAFGMVAATADTMEAAENPIAEVEILTDEIAGPRGLWVGDAMVDVLAAFPNENPQLDGDAAYAALYTSQTGGSAENGWGWVLRRNEAVEGVEYVVTMPAEGMEGHRQELSLFFLVENGVVTSIRVTGFFSLVTAAENDANLETVKGIGAAHSYLPTENTATGPFDVGDLMLAGGVTPAGMTADACIALLGTPALDETDEAGQVRTLMYQDMLVECGQEQGAWQVQAILVTGSGIEGPRGMRIGDSRRNVTSRFGETEAGDSVTYTYVDDSGATYGLACTFFEDVLTEYLLYQL